MRKGIVKNDISTPNYVKISGNYSALKKASGGKVCHLESWLRMHFAPRSSGQITSAFGST